MKKFFALSLLMVISLHGAEGTSERTWGQVGADFVKGGAATAVSCVAPVLGGLALAKSAQIGIESVAGEMNIAKALTAAGIIGGASYGGYLGYRANRGLISSMTESERSYAYNVSGFAFSGSLLIGGLVLMRGVGTALSK
jgi:hypothetical protein